jgi:Ca2+-binding EF-hand superfamily protein
MFKNSDIENDEKDLELMFKTVENKKDSSLNYNDFKKCAFSEEANKIFSNIMQNISEKRK